MNGDISIYDQCRLWQRKLQPLWLLNPGDFLPENQRVWQSQEVWRIHRQRHHHHHHPRIRSVCHQWDKMMFISPLLIPCMYVCTNGWTYMVVQYERIYRAAAGHTHSGRQPVYILISRAFGAFSAPSFFFSPSLKMVETAFQRRLAFLYPSLYLFIYLEKPLFRLRTNQIMPSAESNSSEKKARKRGRMYQC